jgi:hypothetical protein
MSPLHQGIGDTSIYCLMLEEQQRDSHFTGNILRRVQMKRSPTLPKDQRRRFLYTAREVVGTGIRWPRRPQPNQNAHRVASFLAENDRWVSYGHPLACRFTWYSCFTSRFDSSLIPEIASGRSAYQASCRSIFQKIAFLIHFSYISDVWILRWFHAILFDYQLVQVNCYFYDLLFVSVS